MKKKIIASSIFAAIFVIGFILLLASSSLLLVSGSSLVETATSVGSIDGDAFMAQFNQYLSERTFPQILYYVGAIFAIISGVALIATTDLFYKKVNKECQLSILFNKYYKIVVFYAIFVCLFVVSFISIGASLKLSDATTLVGGYVSSTGSIEKEQFFEVFNANSSIQTIITFTSIVYLGMAFVSVVFAIKQTSALIKEKFKDDDEEENEKEEKKDDKKEESK